ncbi:MAG: hypothetical protein ACRBFS_07375 [Aureispira sp.]
MELIEDLKAELYDWCEDEHHLDLQIAGEEDFSKPHLWLRFLDDPMNFHRWHAVELRYLEEEVDSHRLQHFVDTLPKGHTVVNKIMLSKTGFTQAALVLAGELGVNCINIAQDPQSHYYGYLVPVVSAQTIDSPQVLSQREWQQIHQHLEDSRHNKGIEATIVAPDDGNNYTWMNLEVALPVVTPYDTPNQYEYDFSGHQLHITGFEALPINGISFKYSTIFKVLDGREEIEAIAELLEKNIVT